jgi:hypothetical protein
MRRSTLAAMSGALLLLISGCASGLFVDNAAFITPDPCITVENPVYLPGNPAAYNLIFDKVVDIVDDYFEIADANRYDGSIKTFPKIAPGLEQPFKPGSPDFDQRLLATLQSVRHRAVVLLRAAENGGFFVDVKVYKDLEDVPQPIRSLGGAAIFRSDNTLERQYEVIDPTNIDVNGTWFYIGRDTKLEQVILQRLRKCPYYQRAQ